MDAEKTLESLSRILKANPNLKCGYDVGLRKQFHLSTDKIGFCGSTLDEVVTSYIEDETDRQLSKIKDAEDELVKLGVWPVTSDQNLIGLMWRMDNAFGWDHDTTRSTSDYANAVDAIALDLEETAYTYDFLDNCYLTEILVDLEFFQDVDQATSAVAAGGVKVNGNYVTSDIKGSSICTKYSTEINFDVYGIGKKTLKMSSKK